jgi:hypothetical protein
MRTSVAPERRTYVVRLANRRDGRRSGLTVIGTCAIGMCFFPAWTIVSSV